MIFDELVTRVLNLEEQNINLATRQSNRSADADSGISEAKAKTEEVKRESESNMSDGWQPNRIYTTDEYVIYTNALWVCLIDNDNTPPTDGSPYWKKVNIAKVLNELAALIKKGE